MKKHYADRHEFAKDLLKYLQCEKYIAEGHYDREVERIKQINRDRKAKRGGMAYSKKYNNVPCEYDGHKFDSLRERDRYLFLKLQERTGQIADLRVHPGDTIGDDEFGYFYVKSANRKTKVKYTPDFAYVVVATGEEIFEDVKSVATLEDYAFKLKRAMWEFYTGLELRVVVSISTKPGSTKY